jgi:putative RecB family exonuclease
MDHLSSSQINLYLQCGLKYKFQYVDELPKPFRSSGLAFGSALHSALAWLHKQKIGGNGVTLERLYRIFDADWYSQKVENDIRYKNGEDEMRLLNWGREMLGLYLPQVKGNIRGAEVPFTIPLLNPANGRDLGVNLEGFFDLVETDDAIVEFKTSAQSMSQKEADDHLQLTIYSYAYRMLYRRLPKLMRIVNFVKNKKAKMIPLETRRNEADHQRFYALAGQVLKGIQENIFFPRRSFMCADCEYDAPCRAWGGE